MGSQVLLTRDETSDPDATLVVLIGEDGHLLLLGYNKDRDYEWGVMVDRGQKDLLLLLLIKHCFHSDIAFRAWLEEMGIPYELDETLEP